MSDSKGIERAIKAAVDSAVGRESHKLEQDLLPLLDPHGRLTNEKVRSAIALTGPHAEAMAEALLVDFESIIQKHNEFGCNRDGWGGHAADHARGAVHRLFSSLHKLVSTSAGFAAPGETPIINLLQDSEREASSALSEFVRGKIEILSIEKPPNDVGSKQEREMAVNKPFTVFYSWEDDLPKKTNRYFIEACLKEALDIIKSKNGIEVFLDQDTRNTPGTPNITEIIWKKIDACDVFVGDITPVARTESGKGTSNASVVMELEHAREARGWDRILWVFNEAHGNWSEDRPFHLSGPRRKPITFKLGEKGMALLEKKKLVPHLVEALETIIKTQPESTVPAPTPEVKPIVTISIGTSVANGEMVEFHLDNGSSEPLTEVKVTFNGQIIFQEAILRTGMATNRKNIVNVLHNRPAEYVCFATDTLGRKWKGTLPGGYNNRPFTPPPRPFAFERV